MFNKKETEWKCMICGNIVKESKLDEHFYDCHPGRDADDVGDNLIKKCE